MKSISIHTMPKPIRGLCHTTGSVFADVHVVPEIKRRIRLDNRREIEKWLRGWLSVPGALGHQHNEFLTAPLNHVSAHSTQKNNETQR